MSGRKSHSSSSSSSASNGDSNSNSNSKNKKPPNVALLRRALRLVHCLQKERGASGAFCASLAVTPAPPGAPPSCQEEPKMPEDGVAAMATPAPAVGNKDAEHHRVGTWGAMELARLNSDAAIRLFQAMDHNHNHHQALPMPVASTLQKVRALLPRHGSNQTTASSSSSNLVVGFHRILVCYNTLISTVIHECILRYTSISQKFLLRSRRRASALTGSSSFSSFSAGPFQNLARANSIGPLQQQLQLQGAATTSSSSSTTTANRQQQQQQQQLHAPPGPPSSRTKHRSRSDNPYPSSDPSRFDYFHYSLPLSSPPETLIPPASFWKQESISSSSSTPRTSCHDRAIAASNNSSMNNNNNGGIQWSLVQHDSEQQKQQQQQEEEEEVPPPWMELLQLLDCFTRLKESTGMERSLLCSILAAGQIDALWLNDLILQVENQRKLVEELNVLCGIQSQSSSPPPQQHHQQSRQFQPLSSLSSSCNNSNNNSNSHHHHHSQHMQSLQHLVQDVVHMNPNLQALQNKIVTDCNLEGLNNYQQQPNGLWDLLSTYIDKLHSLELLILEEIEYCLPPPVAAPQPPVVTSTADTPAQSTTTSSSSSLSSAMAVENNKSNARNRGVVVAALEPNTNAVLREEQPVSASTATASVGTTPTTPPPNNVNNESGSTLDVLEHILGTGDSSAALSSDAIRHIETMSPDQLKATLLEVLVKKNRLESQSSAPPPPPLPPPSEPHDDHTLDKHKKEPAAHRQEPFIRHDSILDPLDSWHAATNNKNSSSGGGGSSGGSAIIASKEWEIDLYEITFQKRIGRGASGTTYQAKWSGQRVAVKVAAITEMGLDGWRTEVKALQKLHHPNIIRLLGSVCNPSPLTYCLVLEYCSAGDLASALQLSTPRQFFSIVATGIAHGMAYLHSRDIIHRDIKPSNVLLDGDFSSDGGGGHFSVKVSDFGVATTKAFSREDRTAETGTYRWMAPEVIRHEAYSNMADVYSYAVVLWQLLTRENPFATVSPITAAGKVALEGARPPFPYGTPPVVQALIETCWQEVPEERLNFDRITGILASELPAVLTPQEMAWLESSHGHAVYARNVSDVDDDDDDDNNVNGYYPPPVPLPPLLTTAPQYPPPPRQLPASPAPIIIAAAVPLQVHGAVTKNNPMHQNPQHRHNHHHHHHHHNPISSNEQPQPSQPQQIVEKRGSFRRIFPKLARS